MGKKWSGYGHGSCREGRRKIGEEKGGGGDRVWVREEREYEKS